LHLDLIAPLADLRTLRALSDPRPAYEQRVADRKGGFELVNVGGTGDRSPPTAEVEPLADFATESARGERLLDKDRGVPIEAIDVRSASPW